MFWQVVPFKCFWQKWDCYSPSSAVCCHSQSSAFGGCHCAALPSLAPGRGRPCAGPGSTSTRSQESGSALHSDKLDKQRLDSHHISLQDGHRTLLQSPKGTCCLFRKSCIFSCRTGEVRHSLGCTCLCCRYNWAYSLCCLGWSNRELSATSSTGDRGSIKSSCLQLLVPNWTVNSFFWRGKIIIYLITKLNKFSCSSSQRLTRLYSSDWSKGFFGSKTMISHWLSYLRSRRQATLLTSSQNPLLPTSINFFCWAVLKPHNLPSPSTLPSLPDSSFVFHLSLFFLVSFRGPGKTCTISNHFGFNSFYKRPWSTTTFQETDPLFPHRLLKTEARTIRMSLNCPLLGN